MVDRGINVKIFQGTLTPSQPVELDPSHTCFRTPYCQGTTLLTDINKKSPACPSVPRPLPEPPPPKKKKKEEEEEKCGPELL